MSKYFLVLFLVPCFLVSPLMVAPSTVHAALAAPKKQVEVLLDANVTAVKGSIITVKNTDKKIYTLKFTTNVSMVDEKGNVLRTNGFRVGDRVKATGTVQGSNFTVNRLRRVSTGATR